VAIKFKLTMPLALVIFGLQATASFAEPRIGNATAVKNRVDGLVQGRAQPISAGSEVYSNEVVRTGPVSVADLKFIDETSLNVGPTSEITLDQFIYDPTGSSGSVVIQATRGAFRFVTGTQDKRAYQIKTPYGSLGVRGTILEIVLTPCTRQIRPEGCGLRVKLVEGGAVVTTPSGQVIEMNNADTMVTVAGNGVAQGPSPIGNSILQFASAADVTTTASIGAGGGGAGESQSNPLTASIASNSSGRNNFTFTGSKNSFQSANTPNLVGSIFGSSPPGISSSVSPSR
jgi:FecR protein